MYFQEAQEPQSSLLRYVLQQPYSRDMVGSMLGLSKQVFTVLLYRGIYAEGYVVIAFLFILLFIRLCVRHVSGIYDKVFVQISQVGYISRTTHQKAFIFGP